MKGLKHLLIAPPLLFFFAISLVPLVFTIVLSLSGYSIGGSFSWVGVDNYVRLASDPLFTKSYVNTLLYVLIGVLVQYWLALGIALLVNQVASGSRPLRLLFLLPFMMPPLIVGFVWQTMFDSRYGPLSALLRWLHIGPIFWLNEAKLAFTSILIVDTWQWTPFMFLILLAALSNVDKSQTEAAELDGAGFIRTFHRIVLPAIWPVMAIAILIRGLDLFRTFDIVFALTQGGPGTMTETISVYAYNQGFKQFETSYTAAIAFLVVFLLTFVVTWAIRRMGLAK